MGHFGKKTAKNSILHPLANTSLDVRRRFT
jgi:hypothetical protein